MATNKTQINLTHAGAAPWFQFNGSGTVDDPFDLATLNVDVTVAPNIEIVNDVGNPIPVTEGQVVADNAAFTDGTTKVFPAGFIFDEVAGTALTENDAAAARIDSKRGQVFVLEDATTRGRRALVTSDGSQYVVGNVGSGAADSGNPVKVGGVYNSSAPTYTTGQRGDVQLDANGNLKSREQYAPAAEDNTNGVIASLQKPVASSTYAPTSYKNLAAATAANIKGTAGNVYSILVTNANAAIRYLQLHNKATIPLSGETAQNTFPIPAGTANNPGSLILDSSYFAPSEYFATGIGFAISTVEATYTAATAGDHTTRIRYV